MFRANPNFFARLDLVPYIHGRSGIVADAHGRETWSHVLRFHQTLDFELYILLDLVS
jgi:hypothetical protein